MKVFCFYNSVAHVIYKQGIYPSHFLYGAIEIEKAGHELCVDTGYNKNKYLKFFSHAKKILQSKSDILFLPFISIDIFLIILLKKIGLFRKPVIGWMHKGVKRKNFLINFFLRKYYLEFDKIFFLSQLTMNESIESGIIDPSTAFYLKWGADLDYFQKVRDKNQGNETFISTGKENRDFKILINSFKDLKDKYLEIYTNNVHDGRKYDYLSNISDKPENVNIHIINNDKNSFSYLADKVSKSSFMMIPLIKESKTYCVGLSSIVEAMALSKPIISSKNPYHSIDIAALGIGLTVDDHVDSWKSAILQLSENKSYAVKLAEKGRHLAESEYNMALCSKEVIHHLNEVINAYFKE